MHKLTSQIIRQATTTTHIAATAMWVLNKILQKRQCFRILIITIQHQKRMNKGDQTVQIQPFMVEQMANLSLPRKMSQRTDHLLILITRTWTMKRKILSIREKLTKTAIRDLRMTHPEEVEAGVGVAVPMATIRGDGVRVIAPSEEEFIQQMSTQQEQIQAEVRALEPKNQNGERVLLIHLLLQKEKGREEQIGVEVAIEDTGEMKNLQTIGRGVTTGVTRTKPRIETITRDGF